MEEAKYYNKIEENSVECNICPRNCIIKEGGFGICNAKKNIEGKLFSINYGEITSMNLDPIEKKPLFHYKPGSSILSVGSFGCNFACGFCQNYSISFGVGNGANHISPEDIVDKAKKIDGNIGIAFTYNEPIVFYEYMLDTAKKAKQNGLDTVMVSNGYINKEPLEELSEYIDAVNIDLKAFDEKTYYRLTKGSLQEVKDTIEYLHEKKVHVEITHLLIQGFNDNIKEFENMVNWIATVDPKIPFHISRYYPAYKFAVRATDVNLIKQYQEIAKKYLKFVYIGNVPYADINTYCPKCHNLIVRRTPNFEINISDNKCKKCGEYIPIVFE